MNIQLENTFVIAHAEQRDQLLFKIDDYLIGIGDGGEPEGTGILEEVKNFLDNQRSIDNNNENIPKPIHDTLTEIQRSLARIESAKTATTTTNSYSAAATRGQASEAPDSPPHQANHFFKTNRTLTTRSSSGQSNDRSHFQRKRQGKNKEHAHKRSRGDTTSRNGGDSGSFPPHKRRSQNSHGITGSQKDSTREVGMDPKNSRLSGD